MGGSIGLGRVNLKPRALTCTPHAINPEPQTSQYWTLQLVVMETEFEVRYQGPGERYSANIWLKVGGKHSYL